MKNWLTYNFWLQTSSSNSVSLNRILLVLALSLIVISLIYLTLMAVLFKNSKAYIILREHLFYFLFLSGFFLLIVWFFHYQQVAYLGARITLLIIVLIELGWLIYLAIIIKRVFLPTLRAEQDWLRKAKYLPKSKKRN